MRLFPFVRSTAAIAALLAVVSSASKSQTPVILRTQLGRVSDTLGNAILRAAEVSHRLPAALRTHESDRSRRAPLWAPLASLVVPGAGQFAMRQARGVGFVAVEAYAWIQFVEAARDARARRTEYRRTAQEVARSKFGGRMEGPWVYYESLYDYPASGQYNRTPGRELTPEADAATYNGAQWLKAREIFWDDPNAPPPTTDTRYQRAIDFYQQTAWRDGYLWSWRDQQVQWDLYKSTIVRENQSTRDMTTTLGVIIANHLLSGVDALASMRLRRTFGAGNESRIEASVPWPARMGRWR